MENTTRTPLPMASTGCACCTPAADGHATADITSSGAATYRVQGMTCGHCVASVTEEFSALDDVTAVDIDLMPGGASTVTVTGPVAEAVVRAAIEEAGYTLTA